MMERKFTKETVYIKKNDYGTNPIWEIFHGPSPQELVGQPDKRGTQYFLITLCHRPCSLNLKG